MVQSVMAPPAWDAAEPQQLPEESPMAAASAVAEADDSERVWLLLYETVDFDASSPFS